MNLTDFLETLAFAWVIALIAVTYRHILLREPVLSWWRKIGDQYESRWWHAPVWGCHKCVAGQLALWFYLSWRLTIEFKPETTLYGDNLLYNVHTCQLNGYSLIGHLFAICGAVFFSEILTMIYNKWVS